MINPEEIPQYTGKPGQFEVAYTALKKDAGNIRDTGKDVHTQFQGLSAFYRAPEAEQLFATTKPVQDRAEDFATGLETVSGALSSYATEIRPLVAKLAELKTKAQTFVASVKDDDDWEYDEDKVGEHNQLRDDITATVAAFWAAERTCHNKITAIWNGTQMVAGDGSERKDQYGFNAEDLKNAKLPWGDPVEEKHHWYEVGHWVKSFVWDGLIVDGVWGTIKGLGTLVGFGGWDAMGQAWKGLAQLATGLVITSMPGVGTAFWLLPDDKLPSWLRDSRTTMKETGKALVAWDEWGKNPGRAAGAVTFNVLTTVFTGGAGGAAAGAGKAGAVAKVLSVAGKAGKVIDPMTYIAKGAGAGLSKIGDITKALKGVGNIEIPKLPETAIHLPEGTSVLPDGTVHLPEGAAVPAGLHELPGGGFKVPDDVPVVHEDALPVKAEGGEPTLYADGDGNIVDGQGKIKLDVHKPGPPEPAHGAGGPDSTGPAGSDVPRVDSPAKVPAMAGAAPHTVDAGTHINLGDSLGDVGRVGEDVPVAPGVHAGGDIPNVHAGGDLPGTQVGDHLPGAHAGSDLPGGSASHAPGGSADHLPGGSADHLPGGSAHEHGAGPSASHEPPNTHPGGHGDGTGQGPNGHSADGAHDGSGAGHHDGTMHGHADTDGAGPGHGDDASGHEHGSNASGGHTDDGGAAPHDHADHSGHGDHGGHDPVERDVRVPRGSAVEDAARRSADPIQLGDEPLPAPSAGENSLGQVPESRVTRDADGLITQVDGRNFEHFLKDLSFQRGEAFRQAKEMGTLSRRQVGACAGQVMDLRTGHIVEAINGKSDNIIPPDRVHPTLAANFDALPDPVPGYDHPLGHAEVKAVNELLWERTKQGLPDGPSALGELRAAVEFPYTPHMQTQLPGRPAPFCVNCHHMLKDVDSLHGRFTGKDADDSNWIP
ncbi:YwqJ-related putative deaminase [Streptomyces longwoodensis]|uniref:hypothetical protein n=1 Tax=Streptomyces longwoodensis TaxID=68231 RepID=UPI002ED403BA|nr:YwqJ-related putative deaminase [Streptomyces longwoodensis]